MKKGKSLSLGAIIISLFVASIIVINVAVLTLSLLNMNSYMVSSFQKDASESLDLLKNQIDSYKNLSALNAEMLVNNPRFTEAMEANNKQVFKDQLKSYTKDSIAFVTLTDATGKVLYRSYDTENYGDSIANQANIKGALSGNTVTAYEAGTGIKLAVRTGMPVKNREGKLIGVISFGYRLDSNEVLDNLKKVTDNDFTIFAGDTRINTTIMKNGERAIGTKLDSKIYQNIVGKTEKTVSEMNVLNVPYTVAFQSIVDNNGKVVGILFSGAPLSIYISTIRSLIVTAIVIAIIIMAVIIVLLYILIKRLVIKPINKLSEIASRVATGDIDVEVPEYKSNNEIGVLTNSFADMISNTRKQANAAYEISEGNLEIKVDVRSEKDVMAASMNRVISALKEMIADADMLAQAALEGRLDVRADESRHRGDYKKIVKGVNDTLDAIIKPINEMEVVLAKISVNDYTLNVSGDYKGSMKELSEAINSVILRLLSVQDVFIRLSTGDTSRLEEFEKLGKRSENDRIIPSAIAVMTNIRELIVTVRNFAQAALNGELDKRGDENKFEGAYKQIMVGLNKTMEAFAQPIQESVSVLEEVAKGNLTVEMTGDYKGDYAKIKNSLNYTVESFNKVLINIDNAASQVASGSKQVSESAQSLSQGSTEQASSVEELTASMEEIGAQTNHNAQNAKTANELTLTAKEDAIKGNEQMKGMLKAMDEINESSANISKIIKVIDDIAFQTNILALNAAVEAARAGQHGKGFAVVAEEVRNLAARSANAAQETTGLIEGSIKKVEGGAKIAKETANALNEIVESVTKVSAIVADIATASNEQASGIAQANKGIIQVSEVTQANSATAEESAAASEELSSQAALLKNMIEKFKLKKVDSSADNYTELSPEVLKIIGGISKKKSTVSQAKDSDSNITIRLDESDFGKY